MAGYGDLLMQLAQRAGTGQGGGASMPGRGGNDFSSPFQPRTKPMQIGGGQTFGEGDPNAWRNARPMPMSMPASPGNGGMETKPMPMPATGGMGSFDPASMGFGGASGGGGINDILRRILGGQSGQMTPGQGMNEGMSPLSRFAPRGGIQPPRQGQYQNY